MALDRLLDHDDASRLIVLGLLASLRPGPIPSAVSMLPPWHLEAECRHFPTSMFFADGLTDPDLVDMAKEVCSRCPVQKLCAADALADPSRVGIWGGLTMQDRRRLRSSQAGSR